MYNQNTSQARGRFILVAGILVPFLMTLAGCSKEGLTEPSLRKFYDVAVAADRSRDAKAVCAQYADNAVIQMSEEGGEKITKSKTKMCQQTEEGYAQMATSDRNMTTTMNISNIAIAADGKSAEVRATINVSMEVLGQNMTMQTEQTDNIELIDGRPLIVKTSAVIKN